MGIKVDTIFKLYSSDETDEACEDGQCVGKVTEVATDAISGKPVVLVKWWELCSKHTEIDPNGAGPYELEFIWQIGQLY